MVRLWASLRSLQSGQAIQGGLWDHSQSPGCFCCSVARSCPMLCNPMACSVPDSSVLPSPGVCSDSCPLSQRSYLIISSCCPLLLSPSVFPSTRFFSSESALPIRRPEYWSISPSISPSSEQSGLVSSRMDWLDLLQPRDWAVGYDSVAPPCAGFS